jgi:hypothetical protein
MSTGTYCRQMRYVLLAASLVSTASAQSPFGGSAVTAPDTVTDSAHKAVLRGTVNDIAGRYEATIDNDKMTGIRSVTVTIGSWTSSSHHKHISSRCTRDAGSEIELQVEKRSDATTEILTLNALLTTKDWVFIGDEHPMLMLIDSTRLTLPAVGRPWRKANAGRVDEGSRYIVVPPQLRQIINASSVSIRLTGGEGQCDFDLQVGSRAAIAQFLAHEYGNASP